MDSHEHSDRHDDQVQGGPRTSPRMRWPVLCWLFVLVAIGIVQIVRVQWFDAAVFFAAAIGAALAATRDTRSRAGGMPLLMMSAVAGGGGAVLCFLPRHSIAMQAAVIAVGGGAIVLAATGRTVARPDRPTTFSRGIRRLALAWAIIAVAGCVWELIQFILGLVHPGAAWFSLSDLLNPLATTVPGKILIIVGWLAGGVWLLRRGGRR